MISRANTATPVLSSPPDIVTYSGRPAMPFASARNVDSRRARIRVACSARLTAPTGSVSVKDSREVLLQHERAARGRNPRDMTGWDRPDPAGPVSPTTQVDEVVRHIDLAAGDREEQLVDAERSRASRCSSPRALCEVQPKMAAQRGEDLGRSGDVELTSGNPIVSPQDEIGDRHRGNSHAATRRSR